MPVKWTACQMHRKDMQFSPSRQVENTDCFVSVRKEQVWTILCKLYSKHPCLWMHIEMNLVSQ